MNKRFTLWASDWTDNYSTEKFSIGRACFLSSAPNSHELSISPEVLKQCAGSILGCFLVADVDTDVFGNKDFTTHVPQEKIIGYAPVEQTIETMTKLNNPTSGSRPSSQAPRAADVATT